MKKFAAIIILFSLYALLQSYNNDLAEESNYAENISGSVAGNNQTEARYNFEIIVNDTDYNVSVKERIYIDDIKSDSLLINLLPAKYKHASRIDDPEIPISLSDIFRLNKISIAGKTIDKNNLYFTYDSMLTVVKNIKNIRKNYLEIEYTLNTNILTNNFGKASGKNFLMFSDWYAELITQEETSGISNYVPFHPDNLKKESFYAEITVPVNWTTSANMEQSIIDSAGNTKRYTYSGGNLTRLVWFTGDEMSRLSKKYNTGNKEVNIEIYSQNEKNDYSERIDSVVTGGLKYFSGIMNGYPSDKLVIVDVPRTFYSDRDYDGLIPVKTDFISPLESGQPEKDLLTGISRQYFGYDKTLRNRETPYIYYGFNNYLGEMAFYDLYGSKKNYFVFADFYPVSGFLFLDYNQIPIMYTLGDYEIPRGTSDLNKYYENIYSEAVIAPSGAELNRDDFISRTSAKSSLAFYALEKVIGKEKMLKYISEIYNGDSEKSFAYQVGEKIKKDFGDKHFNAVINLFSNSSVYNYSVRKFEQTEKNRYRVVLERKGDGIYPQEIEAYTENGDTLRFNWSGEERRKVIEFYSDEPVEAVQLDPGRKNLMDLNFTDNSYTINSDYSGAWVLSLRWFFWMQNALMIMGSAG